MPKRKRGAQPANTNALKSGFWSSRFTSTELSDLETLLEADGLNQEIENMRVQIRRLQDVANGKKDFETLVISLNTLGAANTRLAGLLRTNQALAKRQTDTISLLAQAIEEVYGSGLDPRIP
jgi:hypothetical protein